MIHIPPEPSGTSNLANTVKEILKALRALVPRSTPNFPITSTPTGWWPDVKAQAAGGGTAETWRFCGQWSLLASGLQYVKGDVVVMPYYPDGVYYAGPFSGPAPEFDGYLGLYICVADHTPTVENAPRFPCHNFYDPVQSSNKIFPTGAAEQMWRRLDYNNFVDRFTIGYWEKPHPSADWTLQGYTPADLPVIKVQPEDITLQEKVTGGDRLLVLTAKNIAGQAIASGSNWKIDSDDLGGHPAQFRELDICIDGVKKKIRILCSEPYDAP